MVPAQEIDVVDTMEEQEVKANNLVGENSSNVLQHPV